METLRLASCQAQNTERIMEKIAGWLSDQIGVKVAYVGYLDRDVRYDGLDNGEIDIVWMCAMPYVRRTQAQPRIEPLVAPVMRGARYGGQPIYFSDVVVQADSRFQSWHDLRGARWATTEPESWSGYGLTAYQLAQRDLSWIYFSEVAEAGSHLAAIEMIVDGRIDAAAIDSTVLELELVRHPVLAGHLRAIEVWGPSPQPPWVCGKSVAHGQRGALRAALTTMHEDGVGRLILAAAQIDRFAAVRDADYDAIREMMQIAGV